MYVHAYVLLWLYVMYVCYVTVRRCVCVCYVRMLCYVMVCMYVVYVSDLGCVRKLCLYVCYSMMRL